MMASKNTRFFSSYLLGLGAQGLFADNVLARLQKRLALAIVGGVGAGNVDGVYLFTGGQAFYIGKDQLGPVLLGVSLAPRPVPGVYRRQLP